MDHTLSRERRHLGLKNILKLIVLFEPPVIVAAGPHLSWHLRQGLETDQVRGLQVGGDLRDFVVALMVGIQTFPSCTQPKGQALAIPFTVHSV
eukprot:733593-Pelagomonas_calceolata.AAC.1